MEYLVDRVASANEAQLVALMYEGLIKKFEEAIGHINNGDSLKLNESISKSRDIIAELIATLKGDSEIAGNYKGIYMYLNQLITKANISKDVKSLQEAIEIVNPLLEGWTELGQKMFEEDIEKGKEGRVVAGMTYGKGYVNDDAAFGGNEYKV